MIVAVSTSKWGGKCTHCGSMIPRGGPIMKVATEGESTKHGQGPGFWIGSCCKPLFMVETVKKETLFDA